MQLTQVQESNSLLCCPAPACPALHCQSTIDPASGTNGPCTAHQDHSTLLHLQQEAAQAEPIQSEADPAPHQPCADLLNSEKDTTSTSYPLPHVHNCGCLSAGASERPWVQTICTAARPAPCMTDQHLACCCALIAETIEWAAEEEAFMQRAWVRWCGRAPGRPRSHHPAAASRPGPTKSHWPQPLAACHLRGVTAQDHTHVHATPLTPAAWTRAPSHTLLQYTCACFDGRQLQACASAERCPPNHSYPVTIASATSCEKLMKKPW